MKGIEKLNEISVTFHYSPFHFLFYAAMCFFLLLLLLFFLGFTLGVQQVRPSNEGEYTCRAQNAAGTQEASAVLYVRDRVKEMLHLYDSLVILSVAS